MSPEQVRSARDVDARTDVWSLGVVLHELLTGAPVYRAETASAVMAMIAADPPLPVRAVRPDVPVPIEAAILRCLLKDRTQRYVSVGELAIALAPFASPRGRASAEHAARLSQTPSPSATMTAAPALLGSGSPVAPTGASWGNTARQTQQRSTRAVLMGVFAAVAVVATIVSFVVRRGSSPSVREIPVLSADQSTASPQVDPSAQAPTAAAPSVADPIASGLAEPVAVGGVEPLAPEVAAPDAGKTASTSKPATPTSPPAAKKVVPAPPANTARPKSPNSVFDNRTF
jgi:serine/threonine-protein kinase